MSAEFGRNASKFHKIWRGAQKMNEWSEKGSQKKMSKRWTQWHQRNALIWNRAYTLSMRQLDSSLCLPRKYKIPPVAMRLSSWSSLLSCKIERLFDRFPEIKFDFAPKHIVEKSSFRIVGFIFFQHSYQRLFWEKRFKEVWQNTCRQRSQNICIELRWLERAKELISQTAVR